MPSDTRTQDPSQRRRRNERLLLAVVLLAAAALLTWVQLEGRASIDALERSRLAGQARAVEQNLARQLHGIHAALANVRDDLPGWPEAERVQRATGRLRALSEAVPGLQTLQWVAADGRVLASSADGPPEGGAASLMRARERPDPGVLFVSPPFVTGPRGPVTLELALVLTDARGDFDGLVTATLDAEYLQLVLGSVNYADDMWAVIVHGEGRVLAIDPPDEPVHAGDAAQPGMAVAKHMAAGEMASIVEGHVLGSAELRLVALRTLWPAALPMDRPLVVSVSRSVSAIHAPWRRQSAVDALLLLAFGAVATAVLATVQRRRAQVERLTREQRARQAADAERLALALRGADLALWDAHLPTGASTVNERWYTMLGYAPGSGAHDEPAWVSMIHPDDRDAVLAAQKAHIEGRTESFDFTYRLRHRDGHWVWVLDRGRVVERAPDGTALRMVGTHMDVTERLSAQEALRRTEARSRSVLDALISGVVLYGAGGEVLDANPAACRILGTAIERLRSAGPDPGLAFIEEDGTPMAAERQPVAQVLASGRALRHFVAGIQRPGLPGPLWVYCNALPLHDAKGALREVVLTLADFSERKATEEQLRASEARLRMSGRLARLGSWRLELRPRLRLALAPETAAILQSGQALDAAAALRLVTRADRRRWRARIQAVLAGAPAFDDEVRVVSPQGGHIYLRVLGEPVRDAGGRIVALQGAVQDVTAARLEQQQLRLLETCVARLNDVVVVTAAELPDGAGPAIVFVNAAFERLWGWRPDEVLGRSPRFLQGPATDAEAVERIGRAMRQGVSVRAELQLHAADGTAKWIETEVLPVADATGRVSHFVAVQRDISDRKRSEALERQLQEAQKMESIGTLAGGIAHDFNNILAAILGNVALARDDLQPEHAAQASLEQINRAGLRARDLVQQILTFSRRQPNALRAQPLRPVVEETLSLLRATLPASVRLDTVLPDDPLPVEADATQIQQVVMNLCTNAWHALPGGRGRIEVGLQALTADEAAALRLPGLQPGPCVHLWVTDNGVGIDEATRERIFDPFFTTKPVGRGTGLGLSVVHGIVRGHRGAVGVESTPGRGSRFHVHLPLARMAARDADGDAAGRDAALAASAGHRVLYVDDDEVMVVTVQRLLERAGWTVQACADPAQALRLLAADPACCDVLVTDYNMPEMSGLELAQQVARLRPGLPVVITSGYLSDDLRDQAEAAGVRALLRKEHTLEELAGLLQGLLAPAPAAAA